MKLKSLLEFLDSKKHDKLSHGSTPPPETRTKGKGGGDKWTYTVTAVMNYTDPDLDPYDSDNKAKAFKKAPKDEAGIKEVFRQDCKDFGIKAVFHEARFYEFDSHNISHAMATWLVRFSASDMDTEKLYEEFGDARDNAS